MGKGKEIFSGIASNVEPYFASDVSPRLLSKCIVWEEYGFSLTDYRTRRVRQRIGTAESYVELLFVNNSLKVLVYDEEKAPKSSHQATSLCIGVYPRDSSVPGLLPDPGAARLIRGLYQLENGNTSFYHVVLK